MPALGAATFFRVMSYPHDAGIQIEVFWLPSLQFADPCAEIGLQQDGNALLCGLQWLGLWFRGNG